MGFEEEVATFTRKESILPEEATLFSQALHAAYHSGLVSDAFSPQPSFFNVNSDPPMLNPTDIPQFSCNVISL